MADAPHIPDDEVSIIVEKLAEVSARLAKMEREVETQAQPIAAASAALGGSATALDAAVKGLTALQTHTLNNELSAIGKRIAEIDAQLAAEISRVAAENKTRADELSAKIGATATELSALETRRNELAARRDLDAAEFAQKSDALRSDLAAVRREVLALVETARRELAQPVSLNPRGNWLPGTYARLDVVALNGSSYVSLIDGNTEKPGKTAKGWMMLAGRGGVAVGGNTAEPATLASLTAGATVTWDVQNPIATVTLGAAANVLTFSNPRAGGTYILILKQDGSGSRTVTWPSAVKWPGGVTPTLTTTASKADVFSFTYDGTVYYGSYSQNYAIS